MESKNVLTPKSDVRGRVEEGSGEGIICEIMGDNEEVEEESFAPETLWGIGARRGWHRNVYRVDRNTGERQ